MPRPLRRMPLELGLDLNINQLLRDGIIERGQATPFSDVHWPDADGEVVASARISADMTAACYGTMRIVSNWIDETIQMVGRPRHYGGLQWYFVCPRQGRHVAVLWSPPRQRFFAGRKAWRNVAYLSQYYGPGQRPHHMAAKLCDRIGGPGASEEMEMPPKPKWMRWRTYERLTARYEKYCDEATALPTVFGLNCDVV